MVEVRHSSLSDRYDHRGGGSVTHTGGEGSEVSGASVNELGIRRIMFAVDDIDDVVVRLLAHGSELLGEVVQYEDMYRLAYVRGPEGIIVGLAEELF